MTNSENYQKEKEAFMAIPKEEIKVPFIPVGIYIQEAEDLQKWAQNDAAQLLAAGLEQNMIPALGIRASALMEAQSIWNSEKNIQEEAQQKWSKESPKAYDLKEQLIHSFRYAYRNNEAILNIVSAIARGEGHADMIQDLNDLAILGRKNPAPLVAINFDTTILEEAASVSYKMADILAVANGERKAGNNSKEIRDQAYTHLKKIVDEVRNCGKYVFWRNEPRLKGYASDYIRRKNRKTSKTTEEYQ